MTSNLVRRKAKPWAGPLCHCGKPARYDGFCGRHNEARKQHQRQWRKVFRAMMERYTLDQAKNIAAGIEWPK